MKYNCRIESVEEEEVTIKIENVDIVGFSNVGVLKAIGEETVVDIVLYGDLEISETDRMDDSIVRNGNTYAYSLYGTLDIDHCILKSKIDFEIDKRELFDYGYLDGKKVKVDTVRIDMEFD